MKLFVGIVFAIIAVALYISGNVSRLDDTYMNVYPRMWDNTFQFSSKLAQVDDKVAVLNSFSGDYTNTLFPLRENGDALTLRGHLALMEGADIYLGTESLRQILGLGSRENLTTEYFKHPIPYVLDVYNRDGSLVCYSDVIGDSCPWRTDWSVPTCEPSNTFCYCPSMVLPSGVVQHTIVYSGAYPFEPLEQCPSYNTEAVYNDRYIATTYTSCTPNVDTYCSPRTMVRTTIAYADNITRSWPPLSYPWFMHPVFDSNNRVKISFSTQGYDMYIDGDLKVSGSDTLITVTPVIGAAASFTVTQSDYPTTNLTTMAMNGVAMTLKSDQFNMEDVCAHLQTLYVCSNPSRILSYDENSGYASFTAGNAVKIKFHASN